VDLVRNFADYGKYKHQSQQTDQFKRMNASNSTNPTSMKPKQDNTKHAQDFSPRTKLDPVPLESFHQMTLPKYIVDNLAAENLSKPLPIQSIVFPAVFSGRPLLVQSQTGTGKTLAYLLPILSQILSYKDTKVCRIVYIRSDTI
jgi:superfamily II DNA/RNA helicase